ncbi:hypothetical protein LAU_0190 [Lausannevirus]|uniref:Uncharacterized protein n=1 Tax=Lausannevirus TaxID=999883 RepID=F2WLB8_9VIRU|nr:hypothetical protein LAU_0190 [Lausannevirus]AEA07041.1 hypothetical protein LAU_0190 [Lausannevirus]
MFSMDFSILTNFSSLIIGLERFGYFPFLCMEKIPIPMRWSLAKGEVATSPFATSPNEIDSCLLRNFLVV